MSINFRSTDFEQLSHKFIFLNETSGTECRDFEFIVTEKLNEEGIELRVPTKSCALGHSLMLFIFEGHANPIIPKIIPKNGNLSNAYMVLIGKVTAKEILKNQKEISIIELKFTQFDVELWSELKEMYKVKQLEIDNVFKKIVNS